jgi:hypothetical protein
MERRIDSTRGVWGATSAAKTAVKLIGANFTFVVFRERVGCDAGPMIPI